MSQVILQPFCCFTFVTGTSPGEPPMHRGMKNSLWWTSLLQQVTKFRSSYSFGSLLRILLRAVNLFSFSHIVSSDSSFNIHNTLYFVKYASRAAKNSPEGRRRPVGHGLKTPVLHHTEHQKSMIGCSKTGVWTVGANILYFLDGLRIRVQVYFNTNFTLIYIEWI